jgi:hypothetical protein
MLDGAAALVLRDRCRRTGVSDQRVRTQPGSWQDADVFGEETTTRRRGPRWPWFAAVVALLGIGIAAWLVNTDVPRYPKAGDCVRQQGSTIDVAGCRSAGVGRVLAKVTGVDSSSCDTVAGTRHAYVVYPSRSKAFVLCVGAP